MSSENFILVSFTLLLVVSSGLILVCLRYRPLTDLGEIIELNALLFVFLSSILLVGGELYYRFYYDSPDGYGLMKINDRWYYRYYHENNYGVRDNVDYSANIPQNRRRVTFIGDSFTAAQGIKNVEERFANRIRYSHPKWEIHVLAKPGWSTDEELLMLTEQIARGYQFDQVVLIFCLNDISTSAPELTDITAKFYANPGWIVQSSYLINTLYYRLQLKRDIALNNYWHLTGRAYLMAPWVKLRQRLENLRELVQTHGGSLSVITFPLMHALQPNYEYHFVHKRLDQFWHDLEVPHLDLLPVYKDISSEMLMVSQFDSHPNEYANTLAADAIGNFLEERMAPGLGAEK